MIPRGNSFFFERINNKRKDLEKYFEFGGEKGKKT